MLTQSLTGLNTNQPLKPVFAGTPKPPAETLHTSQADMTGSAVKGTQAQPLHFQALVSPQVRFGHALFRDDYLIAHTPGTYVNGYSAAKALRSLLVRDLLKTEQGDPSTLKLSLNAHVSVYPIYDGALADSFFLANRPVDTLIQSEAGPASIVPLMMTRLVGGADSGRRYISENSHITMGPVWMRSLGKNHDLQIDRELGNELVRDKESLIMLATGETNRKKVNDDLNSAKRLNALQSLAYGKHGLVDAILMGSEHILTRKGLNQYYRDKGWDPRQIKTFNQNPGSLRSIPRKYWGKLPAASLVPPEAQQHAERTGQYTSSEEQLKPILDSNSDGRAAAFERLHLFARPIGKPQFEATDGVPFLRTNVSHIPDIASQIQIRGAKPGKGIVYDDLILFQDGFNLETGAQIHNALLALDAKKTAQKRAGKDPSNIKILLNSPGGMVLAANELLSAITQSRNKVDVIVQGMAASCGSLLLAGATGNRLATPNARILIHQVSAGYENNGKQANDTADNIAAYEEESAEAIAKASGRSRRQVEKDMRQDTWFNTVEAMFYGPKGLLNGIIVGPSHVITRADIQHYLETDPTVQTYLEEKFGPNDAQTNVRKYLQWRMRQLSEPNRIHEPEDFEEQRGHDPFDNPMQTIMKVAATSAKAIEEVPALKGSVTRPQSTVDQFVVGIPYNFLEDDEEDRAPIRGIIAQAGKTPGSAGQN